MNETESPTNQYYQEAIALLNTSHAADINESSSSEEILWALNQQHENHVTSAKSSLELLENYADKLSPEQKQNLQEKITTAKTNMEKIEQLQKKIKGSNNA